MASGRTTLPTLLLVDWPGSDHEALLCAAVTAVSSEIHVEVLAPCLDLPERMERRACEPDSGTTRFQDLRYDYDPAGNPLRITDALRHDTFKANQVIPNTRSFWYDPRYRLIRATGRKHATIQPKGTASAYASPDKNDYDPYDYRYAYDEVGNFVKNHEYSRQVLRYKGSDLDLFNGDPDEATSDSRTAGNWQYDENGNTTKTPRHNELRYTFDSQPRYVDMGGGGQVRYLRHADQRVIRMVDKGGSSDMCLGVYLGPFEIQIKKPSLSGSTTYSKAVLHLNGHGRHAQAEKVVSGTDSDSLALFYNHSDHLGSSGVLTKSDGTLLSQEEYFPYGRTSDRRESRNRYRYVGVERDDVTSLSITGPRFVCPVSGRFLGPDALVSATSPFAYASSNPIRMKDPGGYSPTSAEEAESEGREIVDQWEQQAEPPIMKGTDPDVLSKAVREAEGVLGVAGLDDSFLYEGIGAGDQPPEIDRSLPPDVGGQTDKDGNIYWTRDPSVLDVVHEAVHAVIVNRGGVPRPLRRAIRQDLWKSNPTMARVTTRTGRELTDVSFRRAWFRMSRSDRNSMYEEIIAKHVEAKIGNVTHGVEQHQRQLEEWGIDDAEGLARAYGDNIANAGRSATGDLEIGGSAYAFDLEHDLDPAVEGEINSFLGWD